MLEKYWDELGMAITICDGDGKILFMNEKSKTTFAKWGGGELIGKSLFDCHLEESRELIKKLMVEARSHSYTIEKKGVKKFIHQTPWFKEGKVMGLIEFSMEVPFSMPHFVRE